MATQKQPAQRGWGTKFIPYTGNLKPAEKPKAAPKSKMGGCTTCGKHKRG